MLFRSCFYTDAQVTTVPATGSSTSGSTTTISLETGSTVEWHREQNYMFRLAAFQPSLLTHYTHTSTIFPPQHQQDLLQILSSGPLQDLSVSRPRDRLSWGVPVPGDPEQTVYVWFDALLVYLSGIGYPWKHDMRNTCGWPPNLQVIGKDILRLVPLRTCQAYIHTAKCAIQLPRHIPPCNFTCPRSTVAKPALGTRALDY